MPALYIFTRKDSSMKYFLKKHDFDTDTDYLFFIMYIVIILSLISAFIFFQIIPPYWAKLLGMCPLHKMTGLYCPGCGGTRSIQAIFHFHPLRSIFYHPIPLYGGVLGLLFLSGRTIARITKGRINRFHAKTFFLWIALALVVINCFIKNFFLLYYHIALIK